MLRIACVGDVFCKARDGGYPFNHVEEYLGNHNFCMANLETVFTASQPTAKKHVRFTTPPKNASFLLRSGIRVVSVANNHSWDAGEYAYTDMCYRVLPQSNVRVLTHAGDIAFFRPAGGWVKAMIAGRVFAGDHEAKSRVRWAVEEAEVDRQVKTILVSLHWGEEHMPYPSPEQIHFARSLIDAGATVVMGHHSHCVQGVEEYRDGLIAYSLGNFNLWQFDRPMEWYNHMSCVLQLEISEKTGELQGWNLQPAWVHGDYRPTITKESAGQAYTQAKRRFAALSFGIGKQTEWEWYELLGWEYIRQTCYSSLVATLKYGGEPARRFWRWMHRPHTKKALAGALRRGKVDRWESLYKEWPKEPPNQEPVGIISDK